jgi:hypothetical protein
MNEKSSASELQFKTNSATVMTLLQGGNVGIGTPAPQTDLHVQSTGTVGGIQTLSLYDGTISGGDFLGKIEFSGTENGSNFSTGAAIRAYAEADWTYDSDTPADIGFYTVPDGSSTSELAERMTILHNGNVGIGVTIPGATLPNGATATTPKILELRGVAENTDVGIMQSQYNGNDLGSDWWTDVSEGKVYLDSRWDHATSEMHLRMRTAGTAVNAISILGSGNVGIGNSAPQWSLDIGDDAHSSGKKVGISAESNGGSAIVNDMAALILGPKGNRTTTANNYHGGGIAFNHLMRHSDNFDSSWNNHMHAYIGLRMKDTTGAEASHLIFATNNSDTGNASPTERMCIESDGNVGIGTVGPLSSLHQVDYTGGTYTGDTRIGGSSTAFGLELKYNQGAATSGTIYCSPTYSSDSILFHLGAGSGNTNQLVLKGDGNVGIGTTVPKTALHVQGASSYSLTTCGAMRFTGNNGASGNMQTIEWTDSDSRTEPAMSIGYLGESSGGQGWGSFFVMTTIGSATGAAIRFKVISTGDTYTNDGSVSSLSDKRAKKNIIDLEDGLSIVNQLKPKTFQYNGKTDLGVDDGKTRFGFIADDVLEVASQYVEIGSAKIDGAEVDDFKSLSTGRMIPMMVKSIQELSTANDELKARIEALENA